MQGGDDSCLLRFPNVKTGDPFVHVYQECHGVLKDILEFRIDDGEVDDFPHWEYTPRRGGFPKGPGWRQNRPDLWFGVSRPEEPNWNDVKPENGSNAP